MYDEMDKEEINYQQVFKLKQMKEKILHEGMSPTEALKSLNIDKKHYEVTNKSECEICKYDGYYFIKKDGKNYRQTCRCNKDGVLSEIINKIKKANIPFKYKNIKIQDYKAESYTLINNRMLAKKIISMINNYIMNFNKTQSNDLNFERDGKGLFFYSETKGSGKTMLSIAIGKELVRRHLKSLIFIKTIDLINEIQKTYGYDAVENTHDILNRYKNIDVLILDDLGMEKTTDNVNNNLFDILDTRLLAKKITIITSNFKIETLKSDDRIINRISEMTIPLEFPAESVRLTLANESNQKYKNLLLK
jgi:DNA replication protein DnaC